MFIYSEKILVGKIWTSKSLKGSIRFAEGLRGLITTAESPPIYNDEYISIPKAFKDQTYLTKGYVMKEDFKVLEIPFDEVENLSGGITANIAF